jgi:hypothetical protein
MTLMLAHLTAPDVTTVVTAFVLGLAIGAALVWSHTRAPKSP